MKKRQVWRYYCEFCGKASCSGGHMRRHEESCTANPERICRMHANWIEEPQPTMASLLATIKAKRPGELVSFEPYSNDFHRQDMEHAAAWASLMESLEEVAHGCPNCILAALRQSRIESYTTGHAFVTGPIWDYKAVVLEFWATHEKPRSPRSHGGLEASAAALAAELGTTGEALLARMGK